MKRITVCIPIAVLMFLFFTISTFAAQTDSVDSLGIILNERSVANELGELKITGTQPSVTGLNNSRLQSELNSLIRLEYADKIETAKKDSAKKLDFQYEYRIDDEYYSIIIRTSTTAVSIKEDVRTFVLGSTDRLLNVNDVLGPNGVKIVNKVIADEMSKRPGRYNPDFSGITDNQSFYVENGSVIIVFNKYDIGSAALGTPIFTVNISGVLNNTFTILKEDSYIKNPYNVKMIPLRMVCVGLGFGVDWDPRLNAISITRDDEHIASLTLYKNIYFKGKEHSYSLEFAPELDKNGVTHLPISFFERILDVYYTVEQDGSITFSYYTEP